MSEPGTSAGGTASAAPDIATGSGGAGASAPAGRQAVGQEAVGQLAVGQLAVGQQGVGQRVVGGESAGREGAGRVGVDWQGPGLSASAPRRSGTEMPAARAALVAVVAGGALAVGAARTVELLAVIAVIQVAFVLAWVLGAAVAVVPGESFDGPEGVVEIGPTPPLLGGLAAGPDDESVEAMAGDQAEAASNTATPADVSSYDGARSDGAPSGAARSDAAHDPAAFDDLRAGPSATGMPGRIGAILIGLGTAAAADVAVLHWPHSELSPMLGILGLAVPVMFAHQLTRGVIRARVVESLSGIALIVVAVIAVAALMQLRHEVGGGHLVAAAAVSGSVAIVVGLLVDLVWSRPRFDPEVPRGLTAVVLATVAGGVIGAYPLRDQVQFSTTQAVLYCAGIAAVSALVAVATSLVGYSSPATGTVAGGARLLRPVALALLPIMLVAPAAYELLVSA